jgi:uncharacterized protein (DUF427 family)
MIVPSGHVEPVPRRIRATLGGVTVFDTTEASYVWEWPGYPQYYVPRSDVVPGVLVDEGESRLLNGRDVRVHGLVAGGQRRPGAALVHPAAGPGGPPGADRLAGLVRFEWSALDAWFEEDEQVFVHPRNPYARVDALRSGRRVRVELGGATLAEATSSVMLFETGLPTRYYLDRSAVDFVHLEPSDTLTSCPYKGTTSAYWSVRVGEVVHPDLAWSYDFPTREVLPVAGLVAFYNERVDIVLDGAALPRPHTHFFPD